MYQYLVLCFRVPVLNFKEQGQARLCLDLKNLVKNVVPMCLRINSYCFEDSSR